MGKKDFDYFGYFRQAAEDLCQAAAYLDESLRTFEYETFLSRVDVMHQIENRADGNKHKMTARLAHEFLPPLEREDIIQLAHNMDNVMDALEDVMRRMAMFDVRSVRTEALRFTQLIVRTAQMMAEIFEEFSNFRSSKTIREKIVAVNALESDGDVLHFQCIRELFGGNADARTLLVWSTIFEELEHCLDAFEDAADVVESVMMKNS